MNSKSDRIRKEAEEWKREKANVYKEYIKTSIIGLEVGLSLIVGTVGGFFVDRYFQVEPWGIIIGALFGAAAAGRYLYRFSKDYLKDQDHKN